MCAEILPGAVVATKPALSYVAQQTTVHGFLSGLRPGTSLHLFFAPGGCNISVVTDVIIPDFLPPSFTDVRRLEQAAAAVVASTTLEVRRAAVTLPWLVVVFPSCAAGASGA